LTLDGGVALAVPDGNAAARPPNQVIIGS
jgi:hypothetical protein